MSQKAETCSRQYICYPGKCTLLVVLFHGAGVHGINVLQKFVRIFMNPFCERKKIMAYSPSSPLRASLKDTKKTSKFLDLRPTTPKHEMFYHFKSHLSM